MIIPYEILFFLITWVTITLVLIKVNSSSDDTFTKDLGRKLNLNYHYGALWVFTAGFGSSLLLESYGSSLSNIAGILVFSFGLLVFISGFQSFKRLQKMKDTATTNIGSMAMGQVEIEGNISPKNSVHQTPLGNEAVVYRVTAAYDKASKNLTDQFEEEVPQDAFVEVYDNTDKAYFKPNDAYVNFNRQTKKKIESLQEIKSQNLLEFLQRANFDSKLEDGTGWVWVNEKWINPDDTIEVYGQAVKDEGLNYIIDSQDTNLEVYTGEEIDNRSELRTRTYLLTFGGFIAVLTGIFLVTMIRLYSTA